jgi:hypothetical protein
MDGWMDGWMDGSKCMSDVLIIRVMFCFVLVQ